MNQSYLIVSLEPNHWPLIKELFDRDAESREGWCMHHRISPVNAVSINDAAKKMFKRSEIRLFP